MPVSVLYWRCEICRHNDNTFMALWKNLKLVAEYPFSTIGIHIFFSLQFIILIILMSNSSVMAVIVIPLLMMLLLVKSIYLYLYLEQIDKQKPLTNTIGTQVDVSI